MRGLGRLRRIGIGCSVVAILGGGILPLTAATFGTVAAPPGGADYGLLTLSVAIHATAEFVVELSPESFRPRPRVASAAVRLARRPQPLVPPEEQKHFFRVARAAFSQRRKMALGVLAKSLGLERERVAEAFAAEGIAPAARAETISLEGWRGLARRLAL